MCRYMDGSMGNWVGNMRKYSVFGFKSAQCLLDIAVYIICRLFMCKAGAVLKCVLIGV